MTTQAKQQSPIEHFLSQRKPIWEEAGSGQLAMWVNSEPVDREASRTLGLCDMSVLLKVGFKGAGAEAWLCEQGATVPEQLHTFTNLEDGGIIVRADINEFFLESGRSGASVKQISERYTPDVPNVYQLVRQDATVILSGGRAREVLLQTCGVIFASHRQGFIAYTRVAGVSCTILPLVIDEIPRFRIWCDYTFAGDLFETFAQIVSELEGKIVGAACYH